MLALFQQAWLAASSCDFHKAERGGTGLRITPTPIPALVCQDLLQGKVSLLQPWVLGELRTGIGANAPMRPAGLSRAARAQRLPRLFLSMAPQLPVWLSLQPPLQLSES